MFKNRLEKVYRHLGKVARKQGISCYRIYDHDLPEFPFLIEFYNDQLYVSEYRRRHSLSEEEHDDWMEECLVVMTGVLGIQKDNVHLKLRQRKPGRLGQYQKLDALQHEFEVRENDLKFLVNLTDYLDTGLFLDHRITRQMVRDLSENKRVLNLFCYTGSFSVYAAAGGASKVLSVDLSKTYLDWAGRNMNINFPTYNQHELVQADVKKWLKNVKESSFDLVILDPPTFSNSKRMDDFLEIQKDHVELINDCLQVLSPGGLLFFSTNFTRFRLDEQRIRANEIKDITRATTPFDFTGKLQRQCFRIVR